MANHPFSEQRSETLSGGLAAGTLVTTPDGDKKIEDIKAGYLVLSGVGEGETSFFEVGKANSNYYHGLILQVTANSSSGTQYRLHATPNHISFGSPLRWFLTWPPEGIFLCAFHDFDKTTRKFSHSVSKFDLDGGKDFHSLDDAEASARSMAQSSAETEVIRFSCFMEHPNFEFMPMKNLIFAMEVPIINNSNSVDVATITNITEEQYDGFIYNLDIPEARNFAANGVLVHDSKSF